MISINRPTTVADIIELRKEKVDPTTLDSTKYIGLEHLQPGGGLIGYGSSIGLKSSKAVFKKGDVLYGKLRPYLNKHALAPFDGISSTDILIFHSDLEWTARLFNYYLGSIEFITKAHAESKGVNLPRVSAKDIQAFPLEFPDAKEQERLVLVLDKLELSRNKIAASLTRLPGLLSDFREAVLWRLLTDGVVSSPIVIGKPENESENNWPWVQLVKIADLESGHTPRKSVDEYWKGGEVPWISLRDIRAFHGKTIYETESMPTQLGIDNSSARLLPKGTVCFSRDISVGFTTIMGREMATTQHFANWICGPKIYNKYLLYAFMLSRRSLIEEGAGTTVKTIYMPALKSMRVLLPSPEEQQAIVSRIDKLFALADRIEAHMEELKNKVEDLPQAVLGKAFSGKL